VGGEVVLAGEPANVADLTEERGGRERGRRGRAVFPEVLAAGIPARVKRELSGKAEQWGCTAAREYQRLAPRYLAEARAVRLTSGGSG
jgi:carbonic anhydrase/acetyltransferase-like protein (isoleucine patch superfamily)